MSAHGLIVGLGNPGREYRETRHNAGFMLADRLAGRWGASWRLETKFFAEVAEGSQGGKRWLLCKPQTYMNVSGDAVARLVNFYKFTPDTVLVLVDDADLGLGTIRLRSEGSSGGHHGVQSIEQRLGTRGFPRLKLGIARPAQSVRNIANYVLGRFDAEELPLLEKVLDRATRQVEMWSSDGIAKAMSLFNGTVE